jgi:DNA-binding NarL/FixJ family response regulator
MLAMSSGLYGSETTDLLDRLTPRRREILLFLCKGLHNAEIAQLLKLSERTVKGYISQLFLIFDVTNRTELVGRVLMEMRGLQETDI